jgi:hypothetical protein
MSTPVLPKIVLPEDQQPSPASARVQSVGSSGDAEITVPSLDEDAALEKFFKPSRASTDNQEQPSTNLDDLDLDFLKTSPESILSLPKKGVRMQKRNHRWVFFFQF